MRTLEKQRLRRAPIAYSVAAALGSVVLFDQQALAQGNAVEEITVTGSRIRQTDNMVSPVPVTAIDPAELTSFDPGGTVAEQLELLPQFFNNLSTQESTGALNFGSGSSRLNLRNLGSDRTLVLFDGSRVVPTSSSNAVNVDAFPTALLRSVEVVTGGASAAYGADALGGVVNFVLDREFEGFRASAATGITEWGDGERWEFSVAGGTGLLNDRLHLIGSVEARRIAQIQRAPEDLDSSWWKNWGYVTNPEWSPGAPPGVPERLTLPWVNSLEMNPMGVIDQPGFALDGYTFTEDGKSVRPLARGDVVGTNNQSGGPEAEIATRAFDNGPYGAETVGRSAFAAVQYDFTDSLSGFAQILVGRSESNSPNRRSDYVLRGGWKATVYRDNAFLPDVVAEAMDAAGIDSFGLQKSGTFLGDNSIGLGDGKAIYDTVSWSVGVDWQMPNGWDMRFSWQTGQSDGLAGLYGQTRIDRMFLGMDAVRDENGDIVCRVQLFNPTEEQLAATPLIQGELNAEGEQLRSPVALDGSIENCVPYNIMGAGTISDAAEAYTQSPREDTQHIEQDFAELLVTGELWQGWAGPLSFASGLTWREQSFVQRINSDVYEFGPPFNAPELGIQGIAPLYSGGSETVHRFTSARNTQGDMDVWEVFAELNMPLWDSPSSSRRLDGSAAYRSSDYSRSGQIEAWKIGLDYQVLEQLRLRATKSRDVREPTFQELFDNRGGGGATVDDPITHTTYPTSARSGGNPRLRPEVADTHVFGLVYQPRRIPGLQLSTDWYEVDVRDAVDTLGAQRIVDGCYIDKVNSFCSLIDRDPASNLIVLIENGYVNVAKARVEGVDFEAAYGTEPDFFSSQEETLSLRLLAGYTIERSDTPLDGTPRDIAGELGSPDLTMIGTLGYSVGPYSIQLQQRYIAETKRDIDWVEGVDVDDNTVSSGNYTNLRFSYDWSRWSLSLNINNLFDRPPPIVPSYGGDGSAQTVPTGYDTYGRRYQLSMNFYY
ncbi:MAG TPA: TonB-dependent receptor [Gammaproteobacteria bacterium]